MAQEGSQTGETTDSYVADAPLTDPSQDRFKRWPFAQRVAETILRRNDPSSLVVAIYGEWGEGKTTVLNFIQRELDGDGSAVCVRFNPWRWASEDELLIRFFRTMGDVLDRSISSRKEKVGKLLTEYSWALLPLSVATGRSGLGAAAKRIGKALSSADLRKYRDRIGKILDDQHKRIVILMDDIDRLDKSEIQAVFKLVRLSADFPRTAYVLAFDNRMVARALSEKYGAGTTNDGQSFLEKIVQVPLSLPRAPVESLRKFCYACIEKALRQTNTELPEDEGRAFADAFVVGLEPALRTPRMCKRYANALAFALPVLGEEVNHVDLMLIEGMRVFYPRLYDAVRENPSVFRGAFPVLDDVSQGTKDRTKKVIDDAFEGQESLKAAGLTLAKGLFPRLDTIYGNTFYSDDSIEQWAKEKRVASSEYFQRYFSYAVPEGDVPDKTVDDLLDSAEALSSMEIASQLQTIASASDAGVLVRKLRTKEGLLSAVASERLAVGVALAAR